MIDSFNPIQSNPKSKQNDQLVRASFYLTYVLLFTTGTITFIEALRTQSPYIRHVMNIETCISIVAAFFYTMFVDKLKTVPEGQPLPFKDLTQTRYTDWVITTPLMLLVLSMVFANENKRTFHFWTFVSLILLDLSMLITGYMGETKKLDKTVALVVGFMFFIGLFSFIWFYFMKGAKNGFVVTTTFIVYIIVWSIYGTAFMMDEETKNLMFNILDVVAKCFVGIFFWLYFTKVIEF